MTGELQGNESDLKKTGIQIFSTAANLKIFYCVEIFVYYGDIGFYVRFLDFKFLHALDISYKFGDVRQNPHLKYLVSFTGRMNWEISLFLPNVKNIK